MPRAVTRTRVTSFFLLATLFCVTFEKVHWNVAGTLGIADVLTVLFLLSFALTSRGRAAADGGDRARLLRGVPARLPARLLQPRDEAGARPVHEGDGEVRPALPVPGRGDHVSRAARASGSTGARSAGSAPASSRTASTACCSCSPRAPGTTSTRRVLSPLTGGASAINVYGSVNGASVYRPNALTGDPNHLGVMLVVPLLALTPLYLRMERGHRLKWRLGVALAFMLLVADRRRSRAAARSGCSSACWCSRSRTGASCGRGRCSRRSARPRAAARDRAVLALALLLGGAAVACADGRRVDVDAFRGLRLHPGGAAHAPAARARPEQLLRLLRVRDRQDELGPALVLGGAHRRVGPRRAAVLRSSSCATCSCACARRAISGGCWTPPAIRTAGACVRSRGASRRRSSARWRRTSST